MSNLAHRLPASSQQPTTIRSGAGTYIAEIPLVVDTGILGVGSIAVADANGDGYTDVFVASTLDKGLWYYESNQGAFYTK